MGWTGLDDSQTTSSWMSNNNSQSFFNARPGALRSIYPVNPRASRLIVDLSVSSSSLAEALAVVVAVACSCSSRER